MHLTGATFGPPVAASTAFESARPASNTAVPVDDRTEDAVAAIVPFEDPGQATFQVSRVAPGHVNHHLQLEVQGSDGAIQFDLNQPQRLRTYRRDDRRWTTLAGAELPDPWRQHWMGSTASFGTDITYEYQAFDLVNAIHDRTTIAPDFSTGAGHPSNAPRGQTGS